MPHTSHAQLVAKMGRVAEAHAELHKHMHRHAGVPEPMAPAAPIPTAGAVTPKGS